MRRNWLIGISLVFLTALLLGGCGGGSSSGSSYQPTTRTYYIAADEVWWDYAPQNKDLVMGEDFDADELVFAGGALFNNAGSVDLAPVPIDAANPNFVPNQIGKVYKKVLYREYTDATFTTLKPVPDQWKHLGTLGPVIRGVVGDTIKVVFKNNGTNPYSVHPHGVFYAKGSEGAPYNDGTTGADKADDTVAPGATHTYTWEVPERAGPGKNDPSSVVWLYHSHPEETKDTNSGLIGPIIITRADMANPDATPKDVDREFINLFTIFNENQSWYLEQNMAAAGLDPQLLNDPNFDAAAFEESNLMHSINGFVFGNRPIGTPDGTLPMTMKAGEHVRWYVLGMGTEVDIHTPHWHGNTVTFNGQSTDVIEILPASMKTVDMYPDNPGIWMYHCHVNDHIDAGMMTLFQVLPKDTP